MQNPKNKPGNVLMEALDFDEDDLEANRNGQLYAKQIRFFASNKNIIMI
jgi:hypothetical protein